MQIATVHLTRATYPYDRMQTMPSLRDWTPEAGEVVLLGICGSAPWNADRFRAITMAIRRDFPVTVGLVLPVDDPRRAVWIASQTQRIGCKAIVTQTSHLAADLQAYLAHPIDLSGDVVEWLQIHTDLSDGDASFMQSLCSASTRARSMPEVMRLMGCAARTTRDRLSRMNLPNPERWFQLIRLLRIQLDLMQNPELSLGQAARQEGFSERQGLDNAVRRSFGVSVHRARQLLGLDWRLAAWMHRWDESTRGGMILPRRELPAIPPRVTVR